MITTYNICIIVNNFLRKFKYIKEKLKILKIMNNLYQQIFKPDLFKKTRPQRILFIPCFHFIFQSSCLHLYDSTNHHPVFIFKIKNFLYLNFKTKPSNR